MSASADWQQDKTLADCNNYMLQNKINCDVSFLVGREGGKTELIEAHKYVLISRSPVFFTMFCGGLPESDGPVRIPDINPDVFRDLLQYIYCDVVVKEPDRLEELIYGAEKYMLSGVVRKCMSWLSSCLGNDTVCPALNCATLYSNSELKARCLEYIFQNSEEVIQVGKFEMLSRASLKLVLGSDDLDIGEATIYEACLRWAEAQCRRAQVEVTDETLRATLGDCLYLIRFTQMPGPRFVKLTKGSNILSPEEKMSLQEYFITREEMDDIPFNVNPRGTLPQVNRFGRVSDHGEWSCNNGKIDAISFSTSKSILLKGISLFGAKTPTKHRVHIELLDEDGVCVGGQDEEMVSTGSSDPIPVRFAKSIMVPAGVQYTIKVSMQGDQVYRGVDGKASLEHCGLEISFFNSRLSKNGTEKTCGQIPGLVFRMLHADLGDMDYLGSSASTSGSCLSLQNPTADNSASNA